MKKKQQNFLVFKREAGVMLVSLFLILIMAGYQGEKTSDSLIPLKSDQSIDQSAITGSIEKANTAFRTNVQSILKQVAADYKWPEPEDNFVMVNPLNRYVSPIALTKEVISASLTDLEKGKVLLLAYFNLPDDAEIASGFYLLYIKKINGEWSAELRNPEGKTILTRKPLVENRPFLYIVPGRTCGMFNGKPGVRFGAQLREISFYIDVMTGTSRNFTVPQNNYAQTLMNEILRFRMQIEGFMKSMFTIKGEVFITTRKDALLIAALSETNGTLAPTMYIRSGNITNDFYSISQTRSQLTGRNSKQQLSATFTDLSNNSSLNLGFIGGIIGSQINTGYVGNMINGEYHITIK